MYLHLQIKRSSVTISVSGKRFADEDGRENVGGETWYIFLSYCYSLIQLEIILVSPLQGLWWCYKSWSAKDSFKMTWQQNQSHYKMKEWKQIFFTLLCCRAKERNGLMSQILSRGAGERFRRIMWEAWLTVEGVGHHKAFVFLFHCISSSITNYKLDKNTRMDKIVWHCEIGSHRRNLLWI